MQKKEELIERAKKALNKLSLYGPDIDLSQFRSFKALEEKIGFENLDEKIIKKAEEVGFSYDQSSRSGSYFQLNNSSIYTKSRTKGLEIYSLEDALKMEEVKEKLWSLLSVDSDKFTAFASLVEKAGYVIIVRKGTKVDYPVQSCLFMNNVEVQAPHNIIIAEEDSSVNIITGCTIMPEVVGLHIGISEFFIGRNARVTFTMVHSWNKETHVRPRTAAIVEEGGEFINYYINVRSVLTLQTFPRIYLEGKNARAFSYSTVVASKNSIVDIGTEVVLNGENSRGEIVSKSISKDNAKIVTRGKLIANSKYTKGHLECNGLILSPSSKIYAVPELESNIDSTELTHEAAIGKIGEDEVNYLMSKGFSKEEATSILIKGFVSTRTKGLPDYLQKMLKNIDEMIVKVL
ncbi:MAG: SufD family Fe-S cluster assembly protein [Thermoproteota archaeon]|nr:SufD family Fe-S cluster assembly protein [Candidatus Brockarchaeota archaeon]